MLWVILKEFFIIQNATFYKHAAILCLCPSELGIVVEQGNGILFSFSFVLSFFLLSFR